MIPKICAEMHCNAHCCKMIIEYAQMLSTAHRVLETNLDENLIYKSTHVNHPCAIWVRQSSLNYMWLYELFICLCNEYTRRYSRKHLTDKKLRNILCFLPKNIPNKGFTNFPKAMPDDVKENNVVLAYRNFYCKYKLEIAVWPKNPPDWFEEIL